MAGKLLFLGDVHLGRRPLRVPRGAEAESLAPEVAWSRAVDFALREKVAALLFAGDVVESVEDRFEAERRLRPGIEKLLAAGIRVLAVAGNHDVLALPRLARVLPGFELIGREGWECRLIEHEGRALCRLHGWSFPEAVWKRSPLEDFEGSGLGADLPDIGLLHCDRDAGESRHAPVRSAEFDTGVAGRMNAWFLGHIHKPDHGALVAERPVGYLGSLVGLDPGEPGRHGPWLVTIDGAGIATRQIPLGPIRYESRDLDLSDLQAETRLDVEDALRERVHGAYEEIEAELGGELDQVQALGLRCHLLGRVTAPGEVLRLARELVDRAEGFEIERNGCRFFCEKMTGALRPRIPLDELASGRGPTAGLARLILDLEAGADPAELRLNTAIEAFLHRSTWADLEPVVEALGAERLKTEALELLSVMLAQRETGA